MRFVLDNAVAMRWLFRDGSARDTEYADAVLAALEQSDTHALAPGIWLLEAGNVIVRAEARGWITEAEAREFTHLLEHMAIQLNPELQGPAFGHVIDLARRFNLSTYDAAYLELALREGIPMATLDAALRKAAEQTGTALMNA